MTTQKDEQKRVTITEECLHLLARDAAEGSNDRLGELIKSKLGDRTNDLTVEAALDAIGSLDRWSIFECCERLTARLMHEDAQAEAEQIELLHGDRKTIAMIFFNITGRNFAGQPTEHLSYLEWVERALPYPRLDTRKIFILVK